MIVDLRPFFPKITNEDSLHCNRKHRVKNGFLKSNVKKVNEVLKLD